MATETAATEFWERRRAIKDAKKRGDVQYVIAALDDPDRLNRTLAARALEDLNATEAIPSLMPLLDDADTQIAGARALGRLGATEAIPRLRELASNEEDPSVQMWACAALANLGDPATLDLALPLLTHPRPAVRVEAAGALGRLGDPSALEPVRAARLRLRRSPVEWWAFRHVYGTAERALRRRAAGKPPRSATVQRRIHLFAAALWIGGLLFGCALLGLYVSAWLGIALLVALAICWLTLIFLFVRKIQTD
jgi:HEAT repeat protein